MDKKDLENRIHELELELDLLKSEILQSEKVKDLASYRINFHENIQKESNKYEELYEFAPSGYISLSLKGEIIKLNRAATLLLRFPEHELLNRQFGIFLSQDKLPEFNLFMERILKSELKQTCEVIIFRSDDHFHNIHMEGILSRSKNEIFITLVDISLHKKSIQLIKESEEKYRSIFNNVGDGIAFVDSEEHFIIANPAIENLFGVEKGQLIGRNLNEFLSHEQFDTVKKQTQIRKQGLKSNYEIELKHPDGNQRNLMVSAVPYFDNNEQFIGAHGIFRDITARKKAEEELRISEKALHKQNDLFKLLLKNLPVGVFMVEAPSGNPLIANETAFEFLGRGIIPNASKDNLAEVYQALKLRTREQYPAQEMPILLGLQGIHAHIDDMLVVKPDGTETLLEVFGSPVTDSQGHIWASLVSFVDITQRKKTELLLKNQNEEIQAQYEEIQAQNEEYQQINEELTQTNDELYNLKLKLEQKEERLNLVIKGSNDAPWDWNLMTNKLYYSPRWFEQIGFSPDEKSDDYSLWSNRIHPDDDVRVKEFLKEMLEKKMESYEYEFRLLHKNGHYVPVLSRGFISRDENDKPFRISGTNMDLTELKKAELELKQSKDQLSALLDAIPDMMFVQNTEGVYLDYHAPETEQLYASPDFFIGKNMKNVLPLDISELFLKFMDIAIQTKIVQTFQYSLPIKQGIEYFECRILALENEKILSIVRNINDRKLAELALKENELRLKSLVHILQFETNTIQEFLDLTLDEAISLTNSKIGFIYFYNEQTKELTLFSWSKEVMNECGIKDEKKIPILEETGIWGEAIRQRKPIIVNDFVEPNPLRKGYPQEHAHLSRFLEIPVIVDQEIVAVIGVANKNSDYVETDILHLTLLMNNTWKNLQKRNNEELVKKQNAELIKLNADKDRFISILAHDLRNPFNALFGFSELLVNNINSYNMDEIKSKVNFIHQISKQTYNLLDDLLMWAKSQSGKLTFNPTSFYFSDICSEVMEVLHSLANAKNISTNCFAEPGLIVFADMNMFQTILRNLMSNAIKFTHEYGNIMVFAVREKSQITVTVADNGIGITKEVLPLLFDISQSYTTKGTANEKGTGLGLALCKEFVEKHGGKIWIESEVDNGSKFIFTIPV